MDTFNNLNLEMGSPAALASAASSPLVVDNYPDIVEMATT